MKTTTTIKNHEENLSLEIGPDQINIRPHTEVGEQKVISTAISRAERDRYIEQQKYFKKQREEEKRKWEEELKEGADYLKK